MEKLKARLEEVYGGGRWIIASQAAVSTGAIVKALGEWGSEVLVVASNAGTGDLPDIEIVYTGSGGATILESIREFYHSVEHPDSAVQRAVDSFDPEGEAKVIAEPHATASQMVGRPTFGVRRAAWSAWEDKMLVDQLWDEVGIDRCASTIVELDEAPLAADELAGELGTVWVADNSSGWHGGGELVRWVSGPDQYAEQRQWFEGRARHVRVMPFLDGLPCSIHGWVTATGVAVFLPVEILILRHVDHSGFEYAGVATLWDAPDDVKEAMRRVSRKVGEHLSRTSGYLGPYGIDGVLTVDGFRPTELNPRMSAGAGIQLGVVDLPLGLLMRAEIEGLVDVDAVWLEKTTLDQRKPVFHFGKMVTEIVRDTVHVTWGGSGEIVEAASESEAIGKVIGGPSATGSYLMGDFDVHKVGVGVAGPLVAETLNLVARKWGVGLPTLEPAPYLVG